MIFAFQTYQNFDANSLKFACYNGNGKIKVVKQVQMTSTVGFPFRLDGTRIIDKRRSVDVNFGF